MASKIIEKLEGFKEFLPLDELDDMDWCIHEIREGHIYEKNDILPVL